MIWVMMNLNKYAKIHGKKIINIFVLIDLKTKNKEDIVFVTKVKTNIYRMHPWNEAFLVNINVVFNQR